VNRGPALIASLCVAACATAPPPDDSLQRVIAARKVLGAEHFQFFYVPAEGALRDSRFISHSRATGGSDTAQQLALHMAEGDRNELRLAVGGPNEAKTVQVIRDAVRSQSGRRFIYLTFLYVGDPQSAAAVRPQVEALAARFLMAAFPP
jgi:hypothetical protein